jgi:hypothetical protein
MPSIDLKGMEKKSWRRSMEDGLVETFLGLLLLGVGLSMALGGRLGAFYPAFFIIFGIPALEAIRRRLVYPRVGRVKLIDESPRRMAGGILGYASIVGILMVVGIFLVFGELEADRIYRAMPIFLSLIMLGAMTYAHGKSGDRRFHAYAAIALVAAPFFTLTDFGARMAGLGYYSLFLGSVFMVVGLAAFLRFLHKHPVAVVKGVDG